MATTQNGYGNLDLSPYKVESRREIVSLLRAISEQKQLIRLLMEGSGEATVTSILRVDEETNAVIIDIAPNSAVNARLLASNNLSFETVLFFLHDLYRYLPLSALPRPLIYRLLYTCRYC